MIREEVGEFLRNNKEAFVDEVFEASGHLDMTPIKRAVVGCLKVLGDRFGKVTKDEIVVAVLVVQFQCAHSKNKSKS